MASPRTNTPTENEGEDDGESNREIEEAESVDSIIRFDNTEGAADSETRETTLNDA